MKKSTKIIFGVLLVVIITVFIVLSMDWGGAESEIEELVITEESQKVQSEKGVEINDVTELNGVYETYDIDSSTSELMFSLDALQGTVGKFKQFSAEYSSGLSIEEAKINVVVDVNSIYTANGMRDESIRGEGFFEIIKYPTIEFNSTKIEVTDTAYLATGEVQMMGLTKELLIPFSYKGKSENNQGAEVAIFEGNFMMNRTLYGMVHTASVGDEVNVNFTVQLAKKDE